MNNISLRQMRAFLLVAQYRNFSRAAEKMLVTQPGLSVMMGELERQLQFRLFNRTPRTVELTDQGSRFLVLVKRSLSDLESGIADIEQLSNGPRTLVIGAPPLTAAYILPEVVTHFRNSAHRLDVNICETDFPRIAEKLRSNELDIGLGMFIKPTSELKRSVLFRFSLMVARKAGTRPIRAWSDLAKHTLIGLPPDSPIQQLVSKTLSKAGRRQPPEIVVNYLQTIISLVAAGAGVAVIPSSTYPAALARTVALDPLNDPLIELNFYEVRKRGRVLHKEADEFVGMLRKHVTSWPNRHLRGS